jgi:hypothetical protein
VAFCPSFEISIKVFDQSSMKRFSISARPAAYSLERCRDKLPAVSPVRLGRKRKSARLTEASAVKIDRREGSWMSRSNPANPSNMSAIDYRSRFGSNRVKER